MNFGFFLSNSSSRRFLEKSKLQARVVLLSAILCFFAWSASGFAQGQRNSDSSERESFDSFLTGASAETNSRSRTNGTRPPEPKQTLEGLFYPEGFLTSSKPSPDPKEVLREKKRSTNSSESTEEQSNAKEEKKPPRFLDPGLETTPFIRPIERARAERSKKGQIYFFAFSVALAALGLFVFFDFRHREQLRRDLERNARLSSPQAVSGDFIDFPPGALDAPVLIPPRDSYASNDYRYGSSGALDSISPISSPLEEDGESLEANFDFTPRGTDGAEISLEPQEDFVVSKTDE